jgi:beta-lactamase superfamily II metal-dependent hydrolase
MEIKVDFLKVLNGDAIHISYNYNQKDINIVIDSGTDKAYEEEEQTPPYDILDGEFKKLINKLKKKKETIDLLILTHVDDDHIGGVLKWMESSDFDSRMIKRVWFNSGQLVSEYINSKKKDNTFELKLDIFESLKTSISDGVSFEDKIDKSGIWDRKLIKADDIHDEKEIGAKFLILSPYKNNLKKLLKEWSIKEPDSLKTSSKLDYKDTIKELLEKDADEDYDNTPHNVSSIAFILEIQGKKFLFLADSSHVIIAKSLKRLKIKYLDVDLVKISHHGSKYNTSNHLLKKINCNKYVISTNQYGSRPYKVTIARIINNNPNCEIYLNYKEELEKKIFMPQDYEDFDFSVYDTKDLVL